MSLSRKLLVFTSTSSSYNLQCGQSMAIGFINFCILLNGSVRNSHSFVDVQTKRAPPVQRSCTTQYASAPLRWGDASVQAWALNASLSYFITHETSALSNACLNLSVKLNFPPPSPPMLFLQPVKNPRDANRCRWDSMLWWRRMTVCLWLPAVALWYPAAFCYSCCWDHQKGLAF